MENLFSIEQAKALLPKRPLNSHKGTFGKVLNIAGSANYTGAAYFSSMAALTVGCGYSILACPKSVSPIIASIAPDLIIYSLNETESKSIAESALAKVEELLDGVEVVMIGCGLGRHPQSFDFVKKFLKLCKKYNVPAIIDADGINSLAMIREFELPEFTLITPHEMELSRLIGKDIQEISRSRIEFSKYTAEKFNCSVLLKGANTVIADTSGEVSINTTVNSGLSKAGIGDVLTGIIAGLASQGLQLNDAAKLGAFIHGTAADIATQELTEYCLTPSLLLQYIPKSMKLLI